MAKPKEKAEQNDFIQQVIEILELLANLNAELEKTYLESVYYEDQQHFEQLIAKHRYALLARKREVRSDFSTHLLTDKQLAYGHSILNELDQLVLDFISLSTIRYRVAEDSESLVLKGKFDLFVSTLHQFILAIVAHIECPHKIPNIKLLQRQLNTLEEAFFKIYPLDEDEEMTFSLDSDAFDKDLLLIDDDVVTINHDESLDALQAFIYTAHLTCSDLQQLLASLDHWSK